MRQAYNLCVCFVVNSVIRGGTNVIPRADLAAELQNEVLALRAQARLNHMDAELHAACVSVL